MRQVSFSQLIAKMVESPAKVEVAVSLGLKKAAQKVRDDATKKFGTYQPEVGPYPAWELLSINTVNRKIVAGGSNGADPLIGHYHNGDRNEVWSAPLRNTIGIKVEGLNAAVGTDDPLGAHHEYGAPERNIPPRPFLRPALWENQDYIKEMVKAGVIAGMMDI